MRIRLRTPTRRTLVAVAALRPQSLSGSNHADRADLTACRRGYVISFMDLFAQVNFYHVIEEFLRAAHQDLIRIGAAVIMGMLVGFEREVRAKPAGLRTMILICVGACVFAMVSQRMGGPGADRTRIAAQIVTGVGFLGAGAILRGRDSVYGLTTAAAIWMVAAVGMAAGFGEFHIAISGTAAIIVVLMFFQIIVSRIDEHREIQKYRIATRVKDIGLSEFDAIFKEAHLTILHRNLYQDGEDNVFTFRARGHTARHIALREKLLRSKRYQLRK